MRTAVIALAFALAGVLAACAQTGGSQQTASAEAPSGRDCFQSGSISGYNTIDDHNVRVSVGTRKYIFSTNWNARDLDWTQTIAVRSSTGWICTGNGLGVDIIGGTPRRTYPVNQITREPDAAPQGS